MKMATRAPARSTSQRGPRCRSAISTPISAARAGDAPSRVSKAARSDPAAAVPPRPAHPADARGDGSTPLRHSSCARAPTRRSSSNIPPGDRRGDAFAGNCPGSRQRRPRRNPRRACGTFGRCRISRLIGAGEPDRDGNAISRAPLGRAAGRCARGGEAARAGGAERRAADGYRQRLWRCTPIRRAPGPGPRGRAEPDWKRTLVSSGGAPSLSIRRRGWLFKTGTVSLRHVKIVHRGGVAARRSGAGLACSSSGTPAKISARICRDWGNVRTRCRIVREPHIMLSTPMTSRSGVLLKA